jgi:hypothetical protein
VPNMIMNMDSRMGEDDAKRGVRWAVGYPLSVRMTMMVQRTMIIITVAEIMTVASRGQAMHLPAAPIGTVHAPAAAAGRKACSAERGLAWRPNERG